MANVSALITKLTFTRNLDIPPLNDVLAFKNDSYL